MNVFLFVSQLLNGLLDGFYYLLIALGLSLIFSLGGIVNLAHGAFYAMAPTWRCAHAVSRLLRRARRGATNRRRTRHDTERVLFTRFYRVDPLYSLLLTFGLAMVIEQALRMVFRRLAAGLFDPRRAARAGLPRRLRLFALPDFQIVIGGPRRRRAVGAAQPHRLRADRAGRHPGPRHPRRHGHLAPALPVGGGGYRHRARRPCGRADGADLPGASGDGGRDHHPRLRRRGDRRPRLVLGRRDRRAARRPGQGLHDRHRPVGDVDGRDLPADVRRPAPASARPDGRAHPAVRVEAAHARPSASRHRHRAGAAALRAHVDRADHDLGGRGGRLRHRGDGGEPARRLHRPRQLRARRLVRAGGLHRGDRRPRPARPRLLAAAGRGDAAGGRGGGRLRRADAAPARGRVFLADDACPRRARLHHRLSLDGRHGRRERARRDRRPVWFGSTSTTAGPTTASWR